MVPLLLQSSNEAGTSYFINELRLLRFMGVSLYEDEGIPYRIYSFFMLSFAVVLYAVLDGYELTKHGFDDGLADIIIFESSIILLAVKIAVLLLNRGNILKLLAKLELKPFLANSERGGVLENILSKKCLWITKAQRVILWGFNVLVCFVMLGMSAFQRIKTSDFNEWYFPFGALNTLNVTYSPNYEITLFYQNFCIGCMAPVYMTTDILLAGVLVHISFQFKILQNYIRQLVDVAGKEMIKNVCPSQFSENVGNLTEVSVTSWKYLSIFLKKAVRYHLAILDLNREVENIFNLLLLAQLLTMTIQFCLIIYVTSIETENIKVAKNVGLFGVAASQAFLVGYWAEEVLHESRQVAQAAYESNFVGTDVRFQKSLILIMRRSESPWKITAGKFTVIGLATFAWIMQSSYSAFTVLQSANTQ